MELNSVLSSVLSLGGLGLLFGVLLGYASKKFEVKVDERIPKVREVLPGANCGGCGYAGCDAYAAAVVEDGASPSACSVGGSKVAEEIGTILGIKVDETEKMTAFVKCKGTCGKAKNKYEYEGIKDCIEANELMGGAKACSYGCLGLGTCVSVCQFGALDIVDGVAKVNREKCTNCGACIDICPKGLIESVPYSKKVRVECNSKDNGKVVRVNCSAGCIGCKICEKNCPKDAIKVVDNVAKIDYTKCVNCGICAQKCPTKVIVKL